MPIGSMNRLLHLCVLACVFNAIQTSSTSATRTGIACHTLKSPVAMASRRCICSPCHACEFNWRNLGCQAKVTGPDVDGSDGSEIRATQPELDAAMWFLSEAQITASRGQVPRDGLAVYSTGNTVKTFAASNEYFSSAYSDIRATDANDSIYLTGWSIDNVPFDPVNDKTGAVSGLQALFSSAVIRGVDVRAIVWQNILERKQNLRVRDYMNNAIPKPLEAGPARLIFDDRLPTVSSSHHQKTLIVRKQNDLVAYVGGVDLTSDRWDTVQHNNAQLRRDAKISRNFDGWLDAHMRIEGPASLDVGANFLARWNSRKKPSMDLLDDLLDFENPSYNVLPSLNVSSTANGTHSVQITRTFSCKYRHYYEYAPRGERSLFRARLKAIRQAKNYIYIEDQYFIFVPELLNALLEVLRRLQRLIVVVQRPIKETRLTGYEKYLFDMVAPLQQKYPNKFQLYTTKKARNLYIHSKLMIIDDVFLSIGSANWNRRSMTSDSEIGANVIDRQVVVAPEGVLVAKLARDLRVRKFIELTGKSYAEIDLLPLVQAANLLDVAATDPTTILDVLEVDEKASFVAFTETVQEHVDPDDRCF